MWIRTSEEGGFSLLEIVVALCLLSVAFFATARLHKQSLDQQQESAFLSEARFLAQDRIARVRARTELEIGSEEGSFEDENVPYTYEEEVEEVADVKGLYRVTLRVRPAEGDGRAGYTVVNHLYRERP